MRNSVLKTSKLPRSAASELKRKLDNREAKVGVIGLAHARREISRIGVAARSPPFFERNIQRQFACH